MGWFNPTLKEMSEENPDISIWGLWWAMTWRTFVTFYGGFFILIILLELLGL